MKNKIQKLFLFILCGIIGLFPVFVSAAPSCNTPLVPCGGPANPCKLCHFFVLFTNIVNFVLFCIVPPLAALMIAIGGFYLIFSGENPENVKKGGGIIKATLIGLLIVFSAWLVVNLFFQLIGVADWTGLKSWWQINCPINLNQLPL